MKKLKGCGCASAAILALALAGAGIALTNSGIQTKIANSVLSGKFPESSVKSVHILPGSIKLEGLDLRAGDTLSLKLESAEGEFLTRALFTKSLEITRLDIKGLAAEIKDVPASKPQADENLTAEEKKRVLTNPVEENMPDFANRGDPLPERKTELPDWSVSILSANADVLLKLPDSSKIKSEISLKSFTSQKLALVKSLDLDVKSLVSMDGLSDENISLRATVAPANNAGSVKIAIEREGKKLVRISGKIDADYKQVETQTQISAESSDVANIVKDVPDFKVHLFAQNNFDLDFTRVKTKVSLKLDAKNLQDFYAQALENPNYKLIHQYIGHLAPIGELSLSNELSAEFSGSELSIANCDILLSVNGGQALRVKNASAFKLNTHNISEIPDGELLFVEIPALPSGIVNAFTGGGIGIESSDISASFSFSKNGENFFVKTQNPLSVPGLKLSRDGEILLSGISPSLEIDASYNPKASSVKALLMANPDGGGQLAAELAASLADGGYSASLSLNGSLDPFIKVAAIPAPMKISANAGASFDGTVASLDTFKAKIFSDKAGEILSVALLSKISYDTKKAKPVISGKILEVTSQKVPFDILKPFAGGVGAKDFTVKISANADGPDDLSADAEISLSALSFTKDDACLARNVDASAKAKIAVKTDKKRISAEIPEMRISSAASTLLIASASADADYAEKFALVSASLKADGNIPGILGQPALEKFRNASNGSAELEASLKDGALRARLSVMNVSPKASAETAGKITADISVPDIEGFSPKSALLLLNAESAFGKTEARLAAELGDKITLNLNAPSVTTDDFEILAKAFANPLAKDGEMRPESAGDSDGKKRLLRPKIAEAEAEKPAPAEQPGQSGKAVWDFGKDLGFKADIAEVTRMGKILVKNLKASLEVDKGEVRIPSASGEIFSAKLDAEARLMFAQNVYELKSAKASLSGLKVDEFMAPNSAGEKMFVGSFDIAANISGSNADIAKLPETLKGTASMTSAGGVLHILDRGSNAGMAAELGSAVLKIGGGILGNRVKELGAIGDLVGILSEMNYSNIHVYLERGEDLDIHIRDAEVRADHLMLKTQGILKHNPEVPFADQAIYFPVKLYAKRGEIEGLFSKIGLPSSGGADANYAEGPTFTVSGTLSSPKNDLFEIISNAAANAALGGETENRPRETTMEKPTRESAIGNILKGIGNKNRQ